MPQHQIDPDGRPYDPASLPRKQDVDGPAFFSIDMRAGVVTAVEPFPEARKPALKIEVDFGPVVGRLWSSAQITNYEAGELLGRTVVGAINLGERRIALKYISCGGCHLRIELGHLRLGRHPETIELRADPGCQGRCE